MKNFPKKIKFVYLFLALLFILSVGLQITSFGFGNKPLIESYNEDIYNYFDDHISPLDEKYYEEYSIPFDWKMEGEENSVILNMHSFRFLDDLFMQYRQTGDEKAKNIIIDWMCDYLDYDEEKTKDVYYAWNDDSVARRVYRLSYWFYLFKEDIPDEYIEKMKKEISYQADMLTDEEFYNKNHNHGMYQDMGLIAYSVFWESDKEKRNKYLELAKDRSNEYFNYVFTSEGVHKEHSPRYGYDIAQAVLFYSEIYKPIDKDFSNKCKKLYEGLGNYFAAITMPNKQVPGIGDSPEFVIEEKYWENNDWYQYVATNGKKGKMPDDNIIFPESGYSMMRSSWKDSANDATYLLFQAATYSSTHKHSDDLNFILYHDGPLFVEAGKRNYDYSNPETKYTYSNFGHNVMLVNKEGFPCFTSELGAQRISSSDLPTAKATKITGYDMESDVAWVEGKQYRFYNANQTRLISYDKTVENADAQIMVKDTVEAKEDISAEFLYHIAPGVKVEETENGWELYRDNTLVAIVEIFSNGKTQHSTITGKGYGNYSTAIYNGEKAEYGSLLVLQTDCKKGTTENGIKITLSPNKEYKMQEDFNKIDSTSKSIVKIESSRPFGPYFIETSVNGNKITAENTYKEGNLEYCFELYNEDKTKKVYKTKYSEDATFSYNVEKPGVYYLKAWIKNDKDERQSAYTEKIVIK